MRKLGILSALFIGSLFAPEFASATYFPLPFAVSIGGTSATSLGPTITNAGNALNTSQPPDRLVTIATDTILSTDAGSIIAYNRSTAIAVSIASASTTGFTQGFGFTADNYGAGTVTITPSGSTINGASSFAIPQNTGCYIRSDGSNYKVDLASCSALSVPASRLPTNVNTRTVGVTIDGGGSPITTGIKGYFVVPYSGTISSYSLVSDISGSVVVDVWKAPGAVPTISNTITASALPTLSSQQFVNSSTLTGWTTSVSAGDVIGYNVNSSATLTRVTFQLVITTN